MTDLTIIMPTWNKERYIAEAIDSVLRQKTRFSYRIVVADDCSTDGTLDIVSRYSDSHPGMVEVLRSDRNLKLYRNVLRAYRVAKTPYFCVLDPDDYWLSEAHIENALSFLEEHREFTVYSTEIERLLPDGTRSLCGFPKEPRVSTFADFLKGWAVMAFTQTAVYRNVVFSKGIPEIMENPPFATMEKSFRADSFRNFLHIREGSAYYKPDVDACYRITPEGIFAGGNGTRQALLNAWLYIDLWRFDGGRHPTLLALARRMVPLVKDAGEDEVDCERQELERFFMENAAALSEGELMLTRRRSRCWLSRLAERFGFSSGGKGK